MEFQHSICHLYANITCTRCPRHAPCRQQLYVPSDRVRDSLPDVRCFVNGNCLLSGRRTWMNCSCWCKHHNHDFISHPLGKVSTRNAHLLSEKRNFFMRLSFNESMWAMHASGEHYGEKHKGQGKLCLLACCVSSNYILPSAIIAMP